MKPCIWRLTSNISFPSSSYFTVLCFRNQAHHLEMIIEKKWVEKENVLFACVFSGGFFRSSQDPPGTSGLQAPSEGTVFPEQQGLSIPPLSVLCSQLLKCHHPSPRFYEGPHSQTMGMLVQQLLVHIVCVAWLLGPVTMSWDDLLGSVQRLRDLQQEQKPKDAPAGLSNIATHLKSSYSRNTQ